MIRTTDVPSANTEERFITDAAASHQGDTQMFWQRLSPSAAHLGGFLGQKKNGTAGEKLVTENEDGNPITANAAGSSVSNRVVAHREKR